MFLVGTNQTTPGRSVSNHDDKGSHFVWRYHELINCDNSAETPVKKAEGPELHFLLLSPALFNNNNNNDNILIILSPYGAFQG